MDREEIIKILKEKGITPEKMLKIAKGKLAEAKKQKNRRLIKGWEKRIKKLETS